MQMIGQSIHQGVIEKIVKDVLDNRDAITDDIFIGSKRNSAK